MPPVPLYTLENVRNPAYQLRYSWTCWPSQLPLPSPPDDEALKQLKEYWETDGIRVLEHRWTTERIQFTVSTRPHVAPVFLAARMKGRLQHALRQAGAPIDFSRKLSLRSLGDARSDAVERYIRNQVGAAQFVDSRTRDSLASLLIENHDVDLSVPTVTRSGRYWYNLHVVFVTEGRLGNFHLGCLERIRDGCRRIAEKKGHRISVGSVMPDHVHLALRGNVEQSPQDIALAYLNNLAYLLGSKPVWQYGFYAGTFGQYTMRSVRG